MAGSHPTGRATRAADVATPTSPATIPETPSNARVFDVSASICPERPIFRLPRRPARAPVTVPFRHCGPDIAKCVSQVIADLRKDLPLRREEAAWRAWITPNYWSALERGEHRCFHHARPFAQPCPPGTCSTSCSRRCSTAAASRQSSSRKSVGARTQLGTAAMFCGSTGSRQSPAHGRAGDTRSPQCGNMSW